MSRKKQFPLFHLIPIYEGNGKFCNMLEIKDALLPFSPSFKLSSLVLLKNNETRKITQTERDEANHWVRDHDANK